MDPDIMEGIERYIRHIRQMSLLTDDQLRIILSKAAEENPDMFQTFKNAANKKLFQDIKKTAKDMTGDPVKFARKVDSNIGFQV